MSPPLDPVVANASVPARTSVVVIGGGIIGVTTALFLAEEGIPVVLCEKGAIGAEQSSRNLGWCRRAHRDPRELPLAMESMRLWEGMNKRVDGETGFRRCGVVFLAKTQQDIDRHEAWYEHAREFQIGGRIVDGKEVDRLLPGSAVRWKGGFHVPRDGRAEPGKAAPAIARGAQAKGATILTSCAVRGIELTVGRISAVHTERGRIACDSVVLAGGVWSSLFCRSLDLRLQQLTIKCSIMRTTPFDAGLEHSASGGGFLMRRRLDGGYNITRSGGEITDIVPNSFRFLKDYMPALLMHGKRLRLRLGKRFLEEWRRPKKWGMDEKSPFEDVRVFDPAPHAPSLNQARQYIDDAFPVFKKATIAESWAGMIDVTPDAIPVISAIDRIPGFFVSTGFSGHGFGLGPGAGRLTADLVMGKHPIVDPAPFRYDRLLDGSARPSPFGTL